MIEEESWDLFSDFGRSSKDEFGDIPTSYNAETRLRARVKVLENKLSVYRKIMDEIIEAIDELIVKRRELKEKYNFINSDINYICTAAEESILKEVRNKISVILKDEKNEFKES